MCLKIPICVSEIMYSKGWDGIENWDKAEMTSFAFAGEVYALQKLSSYLNIYQMEAIYPKLLE